MGRFFSKRKLIIGGCAAMGVVAAAITVFTLQGILAQGDAGAGIINTRDGSGSGGGKSLQIAAEDDGTIETAAEGNWGLSFQNEGSAPVGNATAEYLAKYNAYYMGSGKGNGTDGGKIADSSTPGTGETSVYLTFDAGYENGYTAGILDVLKEEKVPAAFFVVGNFVEENPELVKRMTAEGHIVGNHTMHHPDMSAISDEAGFRKEMRELEEAYKAATGEEMLKFYRPPQGKYSEKNLEMARDMGYTTVFWSLAYVDWLQDSQPSREEALNILNRRLHPGAIVLLHSTSKTNAKILKELIEGWRSQGYTFCSISELGVGRV